jgi:prevent-host-death family protein
VPKQLAASAISEIPGGIAKITFGVTSSLLSKDFLWTILSLEGSSMRYSSRVKPISYLKANAAEVLATLGEQREPLVITQNGEAKAVLQDVATYEATQETLALLKVLALGQQEVAAGKVKPLSDVVARLKAKKALA